MDIASKMVVVVTSIIKSRDLLLYVALFQSDRDIMLVNMI